MAPLCLFYFFAVGSVLGAAALLAERALPNAAPRRWIWGVALVGSATLPIVMSARHSSHIIALWGVELGRLPSPAGAADAGTSTVMRNWLDCSAGYGQFLLRLWLTAAVVLLVWGAANANRVRRLVRTARAGRDGTSAAVVDGVRVIVTDDLGPATAGVWRSRVLVPRWVLALPATRRRYVVRHEEEHRRAHDVALLAGASLLVVLMPWNPALWWQLRRLQLAVEMDCDARVVAVLDGAPAYGELLLDVAAAASRGPRLQPALIGDAAMLERRLVALVAPERRRLADWTLAAVAAAVLVAVAVSVPHPQLSEHPARHAAQPVAGPTVPLGR